MNASQLLSVIRSLRKLLEDPDPRLEETVLATYKDGENLLYHLHKSLDGLQSIWNGLTSE